jgi:hypothetical protein
MPHFGNVFAAIQQLASTPDRRLLSLISSPSNIVRQSLPIALDCTDSGLIHHHRSATNKVNVRFARFATDNNQQQQQQQLASPSLPSSLNLYNRNNCSNS